MGKLSKRAAIEGAIGVIRRSAPRAVAPPGQFTSGSDELCGGRRPASRRVCLARLLLPAVRAYEQMTTQGFDRRAAPSPARSRPFTSRAAITCMPRDISGGGSSLGTVASRICRVVGLSSCPWFGVVLAGASSKPLNLLQPHAPAPHLVTKVQRDECGVHGDLQLACVVLPRLESWHRLHGCAQRIWVSSCVERSKPQLHRHRRRVPRACTLTWEHAKVHPTVIIASFAYLRCRRSSGCRCARFALPRVAPRPLRPPACLPVA